MNYFNKVYKFTFLDIYSQPLRWKECTQGFDFIP